MVKLTLKGPRRPGSDHDSKKSETSSPTESDSLPGDSSAARRPSERVKSSSKSTSPLTKTYVKAPLQRRNNSVIESPSSPDDTIRVHQKSIHAEDDSGDDSPLSDLDHLEQEVSLADGAANALKMPRRSMSAPISNRPWGRKGKAPTRDGVAGEEDLDMVDAVSSMTFLMPSLTR